ncbi:MAG: Sugar transporter substrate-binding protein [Fibrobacteres bacterium]|nr:Sugar transporter substrate-binding protein [Fibrobacterota bacterium]
MKYPLRALLWALAVPLFPMPQSAYAADAQAPVADAAHPKLVVAVIPKGTTHEFWKTVHAGAVKAGREEGAEIIWQGPAKEDDRKGQIEVVQNFTSRGLDAIVLAPLDETALARPVEAAVKRGLKVVIIDSDLKSKAFSSFVATDNYAAGKLAAKHMAEILTKADTATPPPGKINAPNRAQGKVMVMRYLEGSASNSNRENGFLDGLKEYAPQVEVISSNQYAGVTAESALKTSQNLLNKFIKVDGIFTPNAPTTFGMLRALQIAGRAGKVKLIGFDATAPLIDAMKTGEVQGLVVQDPFQMGYLGVKTALAAKRGTKVEPRVDTGARFISVANLSEPAIQELIHPDLAKWLGN